MKNLKVHVFILFKLKVSSTLSCYCFYRSYNSVASLQRSYTCVGGWPKILLCIWGVAGYDLNPEIGCIDIRDFSQSFQDVLRTLKEARIISFDILVS